MSVQTNELKLLSKNHVESIQDTHMYTLAVIWFQVAAHITVSDALDVWTCIVTALLSVLPHAYNTQYWETEACTGDDWRPGG